MCHFLTISVPGNTVPEVPKEFRRTIHFTEHTNRSITEHTPTGWTSFTVTSGGCSCGFYHGADDTPDERSKLETKYRKKGWSEAKIQRVIGNRPSPEPCSPRLRDDILTLVADLTNAFREIRLSLLWYTGNVQIENFSLNDVGRISLDAFKRDSSALLNEATITIKGEEGSGGHDRQ